MELRTFEDIEEFFRAEEAAQKDAASMARPWQMATEIGQYFVRVWGPVTQLAAYEREQILIFGEICDPFEGLEGDDLAHDKAVRSAPHMAYYRWTKCYSVACVDGEYGDTHVSQFSAILTKDQFERAQQRRWDMRFHEIGATA